VEDIMATRFIPVGSEFQVNQGFTDGSQDDADIAVLSDGRFFVAYERGFGGGSSDIDIRGQIVNTDGTLGPFALPTVDLGVQVNPAVAPRTTGAGAGGAVVVWEDQNVGSGDIQLAIINSAPRSR
jgi:hypothetical protein